MLPSTGTARLRPTSGPPRPTRRMRRGAGIAGAFVSCGVTILAPNLTAPPSAANFVGRNGYLATGARGDIWAALPDGSQPQQLTSSAEFDSEPSYSASGRLIAFIRDGNVWLMGADGTDQHSVTSLPEGLSASSPTLSPTSAKVVFAVRDDSAGMADSGIYQVRLDGNNLRRLAHPRGSLFDLVYAPTGRRILFVQFPSPPSRHSRVWVMHSDGTDRRRIASTRNVYDVDWSPTSNRIVYADYANVVIVRASDGREQWRKQVANSDMGDLLSNVAWSPDGRQIAVSVDYNGGTSLRILEVGTRELQSVPVFWPDGFDVYLYGLTWQPRPL